MAKFKIEDSVWFVILESLKIYLKNWVKFTQYMLFPVFGQIVGIVLIFGLSGWITFSIPAWANENAIFDNISVILFLILASTLPGFAIFLKAFWDFLVAYGALNSMTEALISTGKLYDFRAHREVITTRSFKFVILLLLISILMLIAVNPLFWVLGLIFFVYFVLVFQVFTFEPETSVTDCFKRSLKLIKGNFGRTVVILVVLGAICYYLISAGATLLLDWIRFSEFLKGVFESWAATLPLQEVNSTLSYYRMPSLTPLEIANQIFASTVMFVAAGLTLPLRSVCWTLWYRNLALTKTEKTSKKK